MHEVRGPNGNRIGFEQEELEDENGVAVLFELGPGASYTSPTVDLSISLPTAPGIYTSKAYVNLEVEGTEINAEGKERKVKDSWPVTNDKEFKQ